MLLKDRFTAQMSNRYRKTMRAWSRLDKKYVVEPEYVMRLNDRVSISNPRRELHPCQRCSHQRPGVVVAEGQSKLEKWTKMIYHLNRCQVLQQVVVK